MTSEEMRVKASEIDGWTKVRIIAGHVVGISPGLKRRLRVPYYDCIADSALELAAALAKDEWRCTAVTLKEIWTVTFFRNAAVHSYTAPSFAMAMTGAALKVKGFTL